MVALYVAHQIQLRIIGCGRKMNAWGDAVKLIRLTWDLTPTETFREAEEPRTSPKDPYAVKNADQHSRTPRHTGPAELWPCARAIVRDLIAGSYSVWASPQPI